MARHDVLTPVLLSCVSGSATAVGGLIVLCIKGRPSQRLISFVLSFAAGVMVIVSIFDLWWPLARESASAFVTSTACLAAGAGACRLLQYVPIPEPEDLFVHLLGEDPPPGTRRQQELGGMGTAVAGARLEAADDPEAGLAGMSVPGAASAAASSASSSSSSVGAVRHLSPRPSPHAMSLAGDALFDQGAAAHALPPSAGMMMPADASSGSGASLLRRDDDAAAGAVAAGSSGAVSAASSGGGVGIDGGGASARSSYTAGKQSPPVAYDGGGGGVVKARRHMAASWRLGMMLAIVLTIHNLPEGVAVGLGAVKSQSLGLVLCAAIFAHNVAEGFVVAVPVLAGTGDKRLALLLTALSGLSEPIGALVGVLCINLPAVSSWMVPAIDASLCAVAGIMVAVSFQELLPQAAAGKAVTAAELAGGFAMGGAAIALTLLFL